MAVTQRPVTRASCDARQGGELSSQKSQQDLQQRTDMITSTLDQVFLLPLGRGGSEAGSEEAGGWKSKWKSGGAAPRWLPELEKGHRWRHSWESRQLSVTHARRVKEEEARMTPGSALGLVGSGAICEVGDSGAGRGGQRRKWPSGQAGACTVPSGSRRGSLRLTSGRPLAPEPGPAGSSAGGLGTNRAS